MSYNLFLLLLKASGWTISISLVSIFLGLALGTVISVSTLAHNRAISLAGKTFVSFFRGAPLLVQLLLIYNLLPAMGINVPSIVAAIVGLTLCEAADMLGMNAFQQFWRIRAPIALRSTLPAIANEAILILKASSLVSVVGVVELSRMAQDLSASTFRPLPLFATAAFLYLVMNGVVSLGVQYLERSFRWGIKV
jgi:polar amino acid transport system permease protein